MNFGPYLTALLSLREFIVAIETFILSEATLSNHFLELPFTP